jgi:hypothetical protein
MRTVDALDAEYYTKNTHIHNTSFHYLNIIVIWYILEQGIIILNTLILYKHLI